MAIKTKDAITIAGLTMLFTGLGVAYYFIRFDTPAIVLCAAGAITLSFAFLPRLIRNWSLYVNMGLYTFFFIASLLVAFLIVVRHPITLDATSSKSFTISAATRNFLQERMTQPVKVTVFQANPLGRRDTQLLLDQYRAFSPSFEYAVYDPFKDPAAAQRFGPVLTGKDAYVEKLSTSTLNAEGERATERVVKLDQISEESLTNAIVQLQRGRETILYFLTGHDELPLEPNRAAAIMSGQSVSNNNLLALATQLQQSRIKILPLNLATRGAVPVDATAVVVAGPRRDLTTNERTALASYLDRGGPGGSGGKAIFLLDHNAAIGGGGTVSVPLRNFTELLESYGISAPEEVVIMPPQQPQPFRVPVVPATKHRVAQLGGDIPLLFESPRPMTPARITPQNAFIEPILASPPEAYTISTEDLSQAARNARKISVEGRTPGARNLATAATIYIPGMPEDSATKIIAIGDSGFLTTDYFDQNSWLLFANSIGWLSNAGDAISIPAREIENTPIAMNDRQRNFLFRGFVLILPALIGLGGLGYTLSRRAAE